MNNTLTAIKKYFVSIYRSAWDMSYYRDIRQKPWARSLGYLALFNLILTLAAQIVFAVGISDGMTRLKSYVDAKVPDGAHIQVKKGQFSTDLPTPYVLGDKNFTFIIDPSVTGTGVPESLAGKDGMLIGRDAVISSNADGKVEAQSLAKAPDFTVSKEDVMAWTAKWAGLAVLAVSAIFAMAYYVGSLFGTATFVVLASLLSYLVGKMFRANLEYKQWLSIGFHAVTVPMAAEALFSLLKLQVPWMFSALFFLYIAAVVADERNRIASVPAVKQ